MSQTLKTFVYPTAIVGLFALCTELLAGWLAGWPPRCSGQQGPHRVGGNVSGRDQLWGSHEDKVPWWTVGKRDPGR